MAITRHDESSGENTVVGVYDSFNEAENAVQALLSSGFSRSNVQLKPEKDAEGTTGVGTSSDTGVPQGGIKGFFYSLFGGDADAGHHDVYAESVRRGSYVVTATVQSEDEVDRAADVMSRYDAVDIDERIGHWKQQGWSAYDESAPRYSRDEIEKERAAYAQSRTAPGSGSTRIPVVEEQLKVGKRLVERGGIRVFTRVREIPVSESVQLRDEEIKVERHPVDKQATQADLAAFKEGAIELRETDEEAVVSKTARVVEEVVIGKEVTQRKEDIHDTVRRTDVEVEQLGSGSAAQAAGMRGSDDEYRRHWQTTYGSSGGRYEDYDSAYRYGTSMAGSQGYDDTQWAEAEPRLRSDWESRNPGSTWDKVRDAVRYGTQRATGGRRH